MKTDTIGERLELLIFSLKMNKKSFGESIGVSHTTIGNTIAGISEPRLSMLNAILKRYPNVSSDWLISGEGEMFAMSKNEPGLWQTLKENYEKRIEELQYTIALQKQLLGKHKPVPNRPSAGNIIYFFPDLTDEKIMAAEA
ncbi:hypothetical protein QM480_09125 [Flectobacillus sp. DC10W]|jgi:transcriptional regulator with XRE-family HTH domain|uniref:HTH cro/C1-type domain-containing protein n=1 Tax=Flectobacillus longus TaxID=2984207 RepID=A0ABT6YLM7_9BACT|nr:helix-turn-helix domain-containing protein [Flectobacillus longus]MDI9864485.1 hypothetical protein [Flectobacillus longus]